ncbi:MAG: PDZ domain-containing protein [bacterium]
MRTRVVVAVAVTSLIRVGALAGAGERPTAETIRQAAAAARPAVVDVEVRRAPDAPLPDIRIWPPGGQLPEPPEPRRWQWQWQWPPRGEQPEGRPGPGPFRRFRMPGPFGASSQGGGLIVSVEGERGLVAVPATLVKGAQEATVTLVDGREVKGKVLGTDEPTGTGCIEIAAPRLKAVEPAETAPQVGDWVLAVGGPGTGAVTLGIVSATDRPGPGPMAGTKVLLSDVRLHEAMAGCPLVSLRGEALGMTAPPPGGDWRRRDTLTTVVPLDMARATVAALAREGKVRRGFLGITFQPLTPEDRERHGVGHGVEVVRVVPGTAAAEAGVQVGDVIVAFGGQEVEAETFRGLVAARKPGEKVALKILRGGEERVLEVTLGEQGAEGPADGPPEPGERPAVPGGGEEVGLGLSLQPLTDELARAFGYAGEKGLLVTAIEPDGPAAQGRPLPVRRGDLVKEIGRKPVSTVQEARQAIEAARKAKAKSLLLLVHGPDGTRYIVVDLPR